MSFYRKVDVRVHNDAKFRSLSDKAKLLWFTLMTCPDLTGIGAMKFTIAGMAEYMGWDLKAFREAFREPLAKGMIKYDEGANFLCFPNFIKYNIPENPNVVKSWKKLEGMLPECELKTEYILSVKAFLEGYRKAFAEVFPKGLLEDYPKGYAETETETETEIKDICAFQKKHEQEQKPKNKKSQNEFGQFWQAYPKKKGKGAAEKAFNNARKSSEFNFSNVLASLELQKKSSDWTKNGGQFIPFPATWLNQKRWLDEASDNEDTHTRGNGCQPKPGYTAEAYGAGSGYISDVDYVPKCLICRDFGYVMEGEDHLVECECKKQKEEN